VKDQNGDDRFKIYGNYTQELFVVDLKNGAEKSFFKAPERPANYQKMFGMNFYSLQLNVLNDKLKQKLPPTDSRFRQDMRQWDEGNLEGATQEKAKLEEH